MAAELGRVAAECHAAMVEVCMELGGYVVEEIGLCELLLAFPSAIVAVQFACTAQCGLHAAVLWSATLECTDLGTLRPLAASDSLPTMEPLRSSENVSLPTSPASREGFTGFLAAVVTSVGAVVISRVHSRGAASPKKGGTSFLRRTLSEGSVAAFANIHPVTGRCTYSSPVINKAARAQLLARGGQVLFADQPVAWAATKASLPHGKLAT